MNLLKQAALSFERLKEIRYRIVLSAGLKKPLEDIGRATKDPACFQKLIIEYKESMCKQIAMLSASDINAASK